MSTAAAPICNLTHETREDIRQAVGLAMTYWPNSHLGTYSPREDMRSAFKMLRSHTAYHDGNIHAGIGALSGDAYRCADM